MNRNEGNNRKENNVTESACLRDGNNEDGCRREKVVMA